LVEITFRRLASAAMAGSEEATFFAAPADFRAWLDENHERASELLVGFYKRDSGRPSISWPEAVDEALCFGWIDGVRRRVDDESYTIRFTPRKPRSHWSKVNVRRVEELRREGRMGAAGLRAFEQRSEERTAQAAYEQDEEPELGADYERRFRANRKAWEFFQSRPPWYRRAATHWVVGAKREETRERRLGQLIDCSDQERTVPPLTRR
jgi:uncharacterized protein YdeI (YjbR/CyaY-like superfamily)